MHCNNVISVYFVLSFVRHECNGKRMIDDEMISDRDNFCSKLKCENASNKACGMREENGGVRLKLFENECDLLKFGCLARKEDAYDLVKLEYCLSNTDVKDGATKLRCSEIVCNHVYNETKVCGLRKFENGFKIRLFANKCDMIKHNCVEQSDFTVTDAHVCNRADTVRFEMENQKEMNKKTQDNSLENKVNNLVIVDGSMLNLDEKGNINKTIDNFFAATHKQGLPVAEIEMKLNVSTRRRLLKQAGPVIVFKPWVKKPKVIKEDYLHMPTLSTCYHKCPTKCPDTYAPVCGNPGSILAREPSLMFQNHCYMDVAQCKMYRENKSSSSSTSSYIESSFMFCLGDQLNALYRFLPLVRTLQHMGRLKKKGSFNYRLRNMRFFNNYMKKEPRIMGR